MAGAFAQIEKASLEAWGRFAAARAGTHANWQECATLFARGRKLGDAGDFHGAAAAFRKTARLLDAEARQSGEDMSPWLRDTYHCLGAALTDDGQPEAAIHALRDALRLQANDAASWQILGMACSVAGKPQEAVAAYREAIRIRRDLPLAHYNLGCLLAARGEIAEPVERFRAAVEYDPSFGEAYKNLGAMLGNDGKYAAALAAFRKALELAKDKKRQDELRQTIRLIGQKAAELLNETENLVGPLRDGNYNTGMPGSLPDLETTLRAAAHYSGRSVAAVRAQLGVDDATRETTDRGPETAPAPAPAWPSEKWETSPERGTRKQHAIFDFLRRVWQPFIEETGALVTRRILAEVDALAAATLKNALRFAPIPDDIRIAADKELKNAAAARPSLFEQRRTHGTHALNA